jgi:CheY-like chemotaxis protein
VTDSSDAARDPSSRCVLIVEDDDDSREMLGELVAAFGHRALPASTADEALEHMQRQRPDVALIDLGLPEVDGLEVARRLREAMSRTPGSRTRLIALTGYSDAPTRENAGAAGFDDYMVKPVLPEALQALLAD